MCHDTGELTTSKSSAYVNSRFKGYLYHIRNKYLDLMVTDNHKMWVGKRNKKGKKVYRFEIATIDSRRLM
jgi:hypothetical protein